MGIANNSLSGCSALFHLREISPKQPKILSTEDICENAPYLTFFLLTLEMRAYCKSSPQYSCHISAVTQAELESSLFFSPILKLTLKERGEKGHLDFL